MIKKIIFWSVPLFVGIGFYFIFEGSWYKAAGLLAGSILIDVAIDEIMMDVEKMRGKIK